MTDLRSKLDECIKRTPSMAVIFAVSLTERCVLMQRTRADMMMAAAASTSGAGTPLADDLAADDYLSATTGGFDNSSLTAVNQATGGGGGAGLALPPQALIETYVSLAAECAAPFIDLFDPRPDVEWSVARFNAPGWEVVVYRDTARQLLAASGGSALTLLGGTSSSADAGGVDNGGSALDFLLVAFLNADVQKDAAGSADSEAPDSP